MLRAVAVTDIGKRRKMNQDYVFASEVPVGPLPNLFLVADGMGGHNAGDFASKCTVESVVECLASEENGSIVAMLRRAIEKANQLIHTAGSKEESLYGMGTTLVAAVIQDNMLSVANVGDSRLYVIGESIRQITRDHSLVQEMVRLGGLDPEKARNHPDKNVITRAIGVDDTVEADFFQIELSEKERILLCSDGLSNMLKDEEILEIVNRGQSLQEDAQALIEAANGNGGLDNIAVVLVEP